MRYMILMKANEDTEAGRMPSEAELTAMGALNEEMVNAGVMLAGEGLHPSAAGARVALKNDEQTVVDGPFAETKELIAGFWIVKVDSLQDAIGWAKKIPTDPNGTETNVEIRRVFEAEDFGEKFTPELREQEEKLRARTEGQQGD